MVYTDAPEHNARQQSDEGPADTNTEREAGPARSGSQRLVRLAQWCRMDVMSARRAPHCAELCGSNVERYRAAPVPGFAGYAGG
jgi:hypothetical protein